MRINLIDIPEEGKQFTFSDSTGELNPMLFDLLGEESYTAELFIRPINHRDFEMTGSIRTGCKEICSRCGDDFRLKIMEKFHEILIPPQPQDRQGKYAKANHLSETREEGPSVVEYEGNGTFNIGEYLHEVAGIAIPFNPAPPIDEKENCSLCHLNVKNHDFGYDEGKKVEKSQPFASLKNLKLQ